MTKRSKPVSGKPNPNCHQGEGKQNQCKWDDNARMPGVVELKIPDDVLREYQAGQNTKKSHGKSQLIIGWASLVVVSIYTSIAAVQSCQMHESNRLTRDSLVSVQRAFVNFSPNVGVLRQAGTSPGPDAAGLYFSVAMSNSGDTPTREMFDHCNAQVLSEPMPGNFSFPDIGDRRKIQVVLAPKQQISCSTDGFITADEIRKVQSKRAFLYLWGWATYRDVFPETRRHRTEYCFELTKWGSDPLKGTKDLSCPLRLVRVSESTRV